MKLSSSERDIRAPEARLEHLPLYDPHDLSSRSLNRALISVGPTIKVLDKSLIDLISRPCSDPEALAGFVNNTLGRGDREAFASGFCELVDRRANDTSKDGHAVALSINRLTPFTYCLIEMAIARHSAFSRLGRDSFENVVSSFIHESAILLPSFMLRPSESRSNLLKSISHERGHCRLSTDQSMFGSRLDDLWSVTEKYFERLRSVLGHKKPDARLEAIMDGLALLKEHYPVLTGQELFLQVGDAISTFRGELSSEWKEPDLSAVSENILRDTIDLSRDHLQHLRQPLTECAWELFRIRRECDIAAIDDLKELQEANLVSPSKRIVMAHNDTVASYAREAGFKPIIKRVPTLGRQFRLQSK